MKNKIFFPAYMVLLLLFFIGCSSEKSTSFIPKPDKIIVYNNNKIKELTEKDKNFNEIVNLISKRIDTDELSIAQDSGSINNEYIDKLKKDSIAVEFIYENEQEMNFKVDNNYSIKYYKLFFNLDSNVFQYSDKDNYKGTSLGPLNESRDLVNLIKNMF